MKKKLSYIDSVHRDGTIWNLSVMVLLFLFPVAVAIIFGVTPDWGALALGLVATAPMYWAVGIIETITYVPMLGAGGSYLSFVTGNISNLKLPCALNALEQNEVSASSEEGEVISTIAIATSSIVTTIIIIIGVVCIVPLTPVLEAPVLEPAFAQMLPALFGGLGVAFVSKISDNFSSVVFKLSYSDFLLSFCYFNIFFFAIQKIFNNIIRLFANISNLQKRESFCEQ